MRRVLVLGTVIGVAAVSMVAFGQAPTGPSAKTIEATKIEKVKDNLYIITGSGASDQTAFSGGNTAVFITDAGVTLVDTKLPGYGPTLLERIKTVTDKPVTASSTHIPTAITQAAMRFSVRPLKASFTRTRNGV